MADDEREEGSTEERDELEPTAEGGEGEGEPDGGEGEGSADAPPTYKLEIDGEERQLTEAEVIELAKIGLSSKREQSALLRRLDEIESRLEQGNGQDPRGASAPSLFGASSSPEDDSDLDPTDPDDAKILRTRQEARQNRAAERLASALREQAAEMAGNPERYPGFDREKSLREIERQLRLGKRIDLIDAYHMIRGREAPALAKAEAEATEKKRKEAEARERRRSAATLGTTTVGSSSSSPAKGSGRIPFSKVKEMPQAEYEAKRRSGYQLADDGSLVKVG